MYNKKTFEEQLKELQETVDTLRKPDLTLNESMELYKKGIALVKLCSKELNKAEGTLKKLTENLSEEEFSINDRKRT